MLGLVVDFMRSCAEDLRLSIYSEGINIKIRLNFKIIRHICKSHVLVNMDRYEIIQGIFLFKQ